MWKNSDLCCVQVLAPFLIKLSWWLIMTSFSYAISLCTLHCSITGRRQVVEVFPPTPGENECKVFQVWYLPDSPQQIQLLPYTVWNAETPCRQARVPPFLTTASESDGNTRIECFSICWFHWNSTFCWDVTELNFCCFWGSRGGLKDDDKTQRLGGWEGRRQQNRTFCSCARTACAPL